MKILIIAHKVPFPPRGGATLRNMNLLKECSEHNEIHLLTFTQEPYLRDPTKLRESIDGLRQYCKEVKVVKIPSDGSRLRWYLLLFLNLFSPTPYSVWRFHSKEMIKAIRNSVSQNSFDLVEIGTICLVNYLKYTPGLPSLLIHHNIESQLLFRRSNTAKNWFTKLYLSLQAHKLRRLERKACQIFDYHTTVSELDKQELEKKSSELKIAVIENGVDVDYFFPTTKPAEADTLVYAGSMGWYPNAEAMIYFAREIWPLLKREMPSIKMNLVGSEPPKELIALSQGDPAFKLWGFVDDVRPIVQNSAVYIVPITVGGGTRLKILDAMAMSMAIVSTSIGCEGIRAVHGQNIMIADDARAFVEKIICLLNDAGLRAKLGANARRTAENIYSWKIIAPELQKVYNYLGNLHNSLDRMEDNQRHE